MNQRPPGYEPDELPLLYPALRRNFKYILLMDECQAWERVRDYGFFASLKNDRKKPLNTLCLLPLAVVFNEAPGEPVTPQNKVGRQDGWPDFSGIND